VRAHLVLVHGSRLSSTQWAPQVPLLRDEVDLTLVDLPGHGARAGEVFTLARCV
jgi:pimeloyl-ACP methyl ester carboxylesterase